MAPPQSIVAWSTGTTVVDAIGFKFGTGNTADEWFIYDLVDAVLSGSWTFIDMIAPGDGLDDGRISHMQTYCKDGCATVPELCMIGLLAISLLCMVVARRKIRV